MNKVLEFEVNGYGLEKYDSKIKKLLKEWLIEKNNLDTLITTLNFEEMGFININCCYLNDNETEKAKKLTEELLKKLKINYNLCD